MIRDLTLAFGAPGIMAIKSTINSETEWLMMARPLQVPSAIFIQLNVDFLLFPADRSCLEINFFRFFIDQQASILVFRSNDCRCIHADQFRLVSCV